MRGFHFQRHTETFKGPTVLLLEWQLLLKCTRAQTHARTHTYFIFRCKRDIFQTYATIYNVGVSNILQMNRFIQHSFMQGCIKSIKSDSKNFLNNVTKYILFK